jgi:hypothetical protein
MTLSDDLARAEAPTLARVHGAVADRPRPPGHCDVAVIAPVPMGSPRDYLASFRIPLEFAAFTPNDPLPGVLDVPLMLLRLLTHRLPAALRRIA